MIRACDVLLSLVGLVLFAPVGLGVMVVLRLSGEGEVFFRQPRIGQDGKVFGLWKFATMRKDSPASGTLTLADDPRVLPVGRWLRRCKINEVPQLWNVLVGDMALIGPRPQTAECFARYPAPLQPAIARMRPGLSGIGSILFRAEDRLLQGRADPAAFYGQVVMPYKAQVELWFARHQTPWRVGQLVGLTLWVVVRPNSPAAWRWFPDLPPPPAALAQLKGPQP